MNHRPALVLVFVLALTAGCSSGSDTTTGPGTGVTKGGRLYGVVKMRDPDGTMHYDYAGTEVYTSGKKYHTVTDDSGYWALDSLPAGVYTIRISRPNWVMSGGTDSVGPLQFVGVDSFPAFPYPFEIVRPLKAKLTIDSFALLDTTSQDLGWCTIMATCTVLDTFKNIVPTVIAIIGTDSLFHNEIGGGALTSGKPRSLLPPLPVSHGQRIYWYLKAYTSESKGWTCFDTTKGTVYGPKTYAQTPVRSYVIP
jgi:hypothetical protein